MAGGSDEMPPQALDATIIFATVGDLVPMASQAVRKGGRVIRAAIHMSDIPSFAYRLLWEERQLVSVANLTRQDGLDFLCLAPEMASLQASPAISWNTPTKPSQIFAQVGSTVLPSWFHETLSADCVTRTTT